MNEDYRGYSSPLLLSLRTKDAHEVEKLLHSGADPNGVSLHDVSRHAAGFLRFGPYISEGSLPEPFFTANYSRDQVLLAIKRQQISAITWDEISDRFADCVARFWTEPKLRPLAQIPYGDAVPAPVEAAQCGCIDSLESIIRAGADITFWLHEQQQLPSPASISSLAVVTPLHSAIWSRNTAALEYLLSRGFNPNAMPLAAITRCITPAMATIVHCDPWNEAAWRLLQRQPTFNPTLRTPIYNVHILHFAVARLSISILEAIVDDVPIDSAGTSALGHTLLHVACMPLDERFINMCSKAIYDSIHETRDLSEMCAELKHQYEGAQINNYAEARTILDEQDVALNVAPFDKSATTRSLASTPPIVDSSDQTATVEYLCQYASIDISHQDIHGNTALHYLVSHKTLNTQLIDFLRSTCGGDHAWKALKNRYGYTAQDLQNSNLEAIHRQGNKIHEPPRDVRDEQNRELEARVQQTIEDQQYAMLQGQYT